MLIKHNACIRDFRVVSRPPGLTVRVRFLWLQEKFLTSLSLSPKFDDWNTYIFNFNEVLLETVFLLFRFLHWHSRITYCRWVNSQMPGLAMVSREILGFWNFFHCHDLRKLLVEMSRFIVFQFESCVVWNLVFCFVHSRVA